MTLVDDVLPYLERADLAAAAYRQTADDQAVRIDALTGMVADRDAVITELRRRVTELETGPTGPTIPAGYVSVDTFPGAGLIAKLAAASGKVFVPAQGLVEFDADWTDAKRQLVTLNKAVTHLRFQQGTTLRPRALTSKFWTQASVNAGSTNPLSVFQQTGGQLVELVGLNLVHTSQGHNYHGVSLFSAQGRGGVVDIDIEGGAGDGGANPHETFAFTLNKGIDWRVTVRANGQQTDGNRSAVGVTIQNSLRCVLVNCDLRGYLASTVVFYQSALCGIEDSVLDRPLSHPGYGSGCWLNCEQTHKPYLRNVTTSGGATDDLTVSMAGDNGGITLDGTYYTYDNQIIEVDDNIGGVNQPTSTKNGMVGVRYWGQRVTEVVNGVRQLTADFRTGGRYASKGVTLANVESLGYPLLVGAHWAYDGRPYGVKRTALVRKNGVPVVSWTGALGRTMVEVGGKPIPVA